MIQEAITDFQVLKLIRDKYEDLQHQRSVEKQNLAFATLKRYYGQRVSENGDKNSSKSVSNTSHYDSEDTLCGIGLKICGKCKRLGHGKYNYFNCHRYGGTNHRFFRCPKSLAKAAIAEEIQVRQKPPVQTSKEPGQEPTVFTSAHEPATFAAVNIFHEYVESEFWYGSTGSTHHVAHSKREI